MRWPQASPRNVGVVRHHAGRSRLVGILGDELSLLYWGVDIGGIRQRHFQFSDHADDVRHRRATGDVRRKLHDQCRKHGLQMGSQYRPESINGVAQTAPGGNKIFMTLWDGGGHDTYDFSNYTTNLSVNLQPGAWTTLSAAQVADLGAGHSAAGNIANALLFQGNTASLIDDAIGGSGNDTIVGNAADNKLTGGAGNDTLDGGAGTDTAVYSGAAANYQFVHNINGSWTVTDLRVGHPDGVDTLTNIEFIQFSDQTVAIDLLGASGPQVPTFTSFSNDSGASGDGITNDNTLTLTGTGTAGNTVSIYDGLVLLGQRRLPPVASGVLILRHLSMALIALRRRRPTAPPRRRLRRPSSSPSTRSRRVPRHLVLCSRRIATSPATSSPTRIR